ncbi:MAG: tRNA (N6-isopentenyl adenosine(37)-C2)-methylthiotransferase MiaB [Deltaproteobacteria bacterium]|nr:tRNA (N6-isopentenyl adenosine(37)-C2)-methylthiotransferase MiaB [Deltaproteobacteria bacterium]
MPRFFIRTYGCQMNVHDSHKVANLLLHAGYSSAEDEAEAELLIINTCSIREKAEHRLYSDLGVLRDWKAERDDRVLAVAGCVAQQEGDALLKRFGHVDFVFGTHNLRFVPDMASAARDGRRSVRTEETATLDRFDLPERHPGFESDTAGRAYVTVMEGCDMFCSFCVVPTTRGREISRPAAAIVEEARALAERGVLEITLLGQTVNAYGRHDLRRGRADQAGTVAFAELLRQLDAIPDLERVRYTSPHPIFFDDALVRAHGELESLCPHVHLPAQSGSDRVLERMRRRYRADDLRRLAEALRAARPDVALTTDLIVGFPGESEDDFEQTLRLVRDVGFVDSFSFKYSARPNTTAAGFEGAVPPAEAQARLERLQTLQRALTLEYHRSRVGQSTRVLVEGESRRGGQQRAGRDPYHRVVNFAAAADGGPAPGRFACLKIVEATPHSLIGELSGLPSRLTAVKPESRVADVAGRSVAAEG